MQMPDNMSFVTKDVKVYFAGAGCGKTHALMDEMTELLKVYRPDEIAFVTYTKKGVSHGIERAIEANPMLRKEDLVYFKTLHALCFHALNLKSKNVLTQNDMKTFNSRLGFKVTLAEAFENQTNDDRLLLRYDALRSGSTKDIYLNGQYDEIRYQRLIKAYETFKKQTNTVDFYDCLEMFCKRNKPINVKVAFIDEAQDLTLLQWEVCRIAFSTCEKIVIAGDESQTIFSHSGSSPKTLISLAEKYNAIKLEQSYRLPEEVYRFSKGITNLITDKVDKDFRPVKDVKGFVERTANRYTLCGKVMRDFLKNGYSPYRWYFLFRNNCFIDSVAEELDRLLVPYHTHKGFCLNIRDLAKIKRYENFRKAGFGTPETLETFCKKYNIKDINDSFLESDLIPSPRNLTYFTYVEKYGIDTLIEMAEKEPFLLLSTTHRVKGGEADFVSVFLDCTQKVWQNQMTNVDEELRVLYVACSRAKLGLYLVQSETKYGLDRMVDLIREKVA